MTVEYNDKLDADDQISMEELIARYLDGIELADEEACQDAGRDILKMVLVKFRPDLIEG